MTKVWLIRPFPWMCPNCRKKEVRTFHVQKDDSLRAVCNECGNAVYAGVPETFDADILKGTLKHNSSSDTEIK